VPKMDEEEWSDEFVDALESVENKGEFCFSMPIGRELSPLQPKITVEGTSERIAFPLANTQAELLRSFAEKAPYGKGSDTVLDESVRKAWQIDSKKIHFGDKQQWDAILSKITRTCVGRLGLSSDEQARCQANLYKMILYEPGGHFKKHRDTEKEPGMFGTLIIQLPAKYCGGSLVIEHGGTKKTFDLSESSEDDFFATVFYADCKHELRPVTDGWRLALVYNLVLQSCPSSLSLPSAEDLTSQAKQFCRLAEQWPISSGRKICRGYLLEHKYTETNLSFANLKGRDKQVVDTVRSARSIDGSPLFVACLLLIERHQTGSPGCSGGGYYDDCSDHEMCDVHDEDTGPKLWVGPDGQQLTSFGLEFDHGDIFGFEDEDEFWGEEPDEQDYEGYMGNYGPTVQYWYRRSAVVFWPRSLNNEVLSRAGQSFANSYLNVAPSSEVLSIAKTVVKSIENGGSEPTSNLILGILRSNDESLVLRVIKKVKAIPDDAFGKALTTVTKNMASVAIRDEIVELVKRSITSAPSYALGRVIKSSATISKYINDSDASFCSDIKEAIVAGVLVRSSTFLSHTEAVKVVVPIALKCKASTFADFTKVVLEHATPLQLKTVLTFLMKKGSAATMSEVMGLYNKRLAQLVQATANGPPTFSWRQPHAKFDGSQASIVNAFLKSEKREKTFAGFNGIGHARNWAAKYWGSGYASKGKGYSGNALSGGRGSDAYVTVTKTRGAYDAKLAQYRCDVAEMESLQSFFETSKRQAPSSDGESDKRVKVE